MPPRPATPTRRVWEPQRSRSCAVLEISRSLSSTLDLYAVLEKTLAVLFDIFPQADRGFVLLRGDAGDDWAGGVSHSRHEGAASLAASRTILRRVVETGEAILCKDATSENPDSPSLAALAIHSLVCAPLFDRGRHPIGVIQLDARDELVSFGPEDLDLLAAVAGPVGVAVQNSHLHAALRRRGEVEQELRWARRVLEALLKPWQGGPAGYAFWDYYEPACQVGGDYYGYFPMPRPDDPPNGPPRRWAVAVGDVSGKGMPAALLVAHLAAEVGPALAEEPDPGRVVGRLNRRLCGSNLEDMFITFLLVVIDAVEHRLSVVNAGHMGPLVRHSDGRVEVVGLVGEALPLGVEEDLDYTASTAELACGDIVVLYTDGVNEAQSSAGRMFGDLALQSAIASAPASAAAAGAAILEALRRHADGCEQSDDITLLCFGRPM